MPRSRQKFSACFKVVLRQRAIVSSAAPGNHPSPFSVFHFERTAHPLIGQCCCPLAPSLICKSSICRSYHIDTSAEARLYPNRSTHAFRSDCCFGPCPAGADDIKPGFAILHDEGGSAAAFRVAASLFASSRTLLGRGAGTLGSSDHQTRQHHR